MQVYDANTDVIVRQKKDSSRKLNTKLKDIKFSDYDVGTVKITSLTCNDEVLMMNSDSHTYSWQKFNEILLIDSNIKEGFFQFEGYYGVGGSGFHDEIKVCKSVSAKTPIVCRINTYKKVVTAEELYKLAWMNNVELYGYCRDIKHNIQKLRVVELPLIIDKCCKTVAISSVGIDLPNNMFILTRKDSDYIF